MSKTNKSQYVVSAETTDELEQLQQELEALRRTRASVNALERMAACLKQNIQIAIKNTDTLSDLNQGWEIFFTGKK
ncbi:hypothetical protein GN956_G11469 [Arapaima gigas]